MNSGCQKHFFVSFLTFSQPKQRKFWKSGKYGNRMALRAI